MSWFRDHSTGSSYTGFQTILGVMSNERSSVIIDFENKIGKKRCKHSSNGQYSPSSHTGHRQKDAKKSKTVLSLDMIRRALKHGLNFSYVLWDSWYNNSESFKFVFQKLVPKGIHLISMLKLVSTKYLYNNIEYDLKELYTKAGNWVQIDGKNIMTKSLIIGVIDVGDPERKKSGEVKLCFFKYLCKVQKKRKPGKKKKTTKRVKYKA